MRAPADATGTRTAGPARDRTVLVWTARTPTVHPVERFQTGLLILAMGVGIAVGQYADLAAAADRAVLPALLGVLFLTFLGVPLGAVRGALADRRFVATSLGFNFLWTPLLAAGLATLFLRDHPDLWVGLLMLLVTPCTDWYLAFTDLADGNVPLATSLLPYNLLLQVALLPVYLYVFAGAAVDVPVAALVEAVLFVLVAPLVGAAVARYAAVRLRSRRWLARVADRTGPAQVVLLAVAVGAMFASQGALLLERPLVPVLIGVPLLAFFAVNFVAGTLVSRVAGFDYEDRVCFACTTLARNSPTALAVAVAAFPDRPLIALALVVGPLVELPLLSVLTRVLRATRGNDTAPASA